MPSSSRPGFGAALAGLLLLAVSTSLNAQARPSSTKLLPTAWKPIIAEGTHGPAWLAPIASAVMPGAGQLLRKEDRGAIYLIAEAFLVQRFVSLWIGAHNAEDRYRSLAFSVARAPYAPSARDTVFEYFEQMGRFAESGPYDTDPGTRLVPPVDEETYNGAIWALARRTYFSGTVAPPDTSLTYQAALAFYRRRAIGSNYQWSWRSLGVEQDLFRQTIREGDETYRRAVGQLGLLLANHFLSAVDAFVSQKLSTPRHQVRLGPDLWQPQGDPAPSLLFRVGITF